MAGTINIPLFSTFNDSGILKAQKALGGLGTSLSSIGKMATGAIVGFQALHQSIAFISGSVNAARDLQRNMAGLTTIFGTSTGQMQKFVDTSESMGMSHAKAAQAVTFLGSVFKQTGMPMEKVISQTKTMVSLGADLASTYGYSVDEALTAMTATFRGEYDPIEKFGVAMKQQQVNAELAAMGLGKLKGQALIAAQQQVRYNMILQRTTDAQGAFARQSGNLFEQQQILQAVWTDMQATLGQQLTPAFTNLLSAVQPIITTLGPALSGVFASIGDMITQLVPHLATLGEDVTKMFEALSASFDIFGPIVMNLISFIADNLPALLTFMAVFKGSKFILEMAGVFKELRVAIMGATAAQVGLNVAMDANPIGLVVLAISSLVGWLVTAKTAYDNAATSAGKLAAAQADKNYARKLFLDSGLQDVTSKMWTPKQSAAGAAADANRYTAQETMGLALGLGAKKPTIPTTPTVDTPTKKTAAQKAAEAWTKKHAAAIVKAVKEQQAAVKKANDERLADIQKSADDLKSVYERMTADAKAFGESFNAAIGSFKKLGEIAPVLGAFEQQTSDALQSLRDQAKDAFGKGLFGTGITADKALSELNKLVDGQAKALTEYAKQRDVLAKKIDIARQISGSVLGFGNITSALQQTKNAVIQTSTQIIDGVSVTISKSVDEIQTADLVGEYKKILDKTKDFAKNLKALKAAGLDSGLFAQIVDAGVESGGATAAAIIAGGGDTITELNSLFADLQTTGSDIAALTTDIMYANGGDIVNGFIDGLLAEDAKLKKAASDMAATFSVTFTDAIMKAIQAAIDAAKTLSDQAAYKAATGSGDLTNYIMGATAGMSGAALDKQLAMLNGSDVSAPGSFMNSLGYMSASQQPGTTVNLTVDGKVLATSLLTYERTNGAIYVRAI